MTTQKGKQIISNLQLGGIADSRYSGTENSQYEIYGINIHGEPGIIEAQQGAAVDVASGDTPDEIIVAMVTADNNLTYCFGANGTIWTRNSSNVYAELGSITSGSAYGVIMDAKEFNGSLYYTMQQRVGKYTPGDSWAARDDNFLTIEFDLFHPMMVLENDLYIGHTNKVAKITPTTTTGAAADNVLTFDTDFTVESFGNRLSNLVVGTRAQGTAAGSFAGFSHIFEWDLVSPSWSREEAVDEFGISCFLKLKGNLLFNAGNKGMLYSWNGQHAAQFKRIPGDWTGTNAARIKKNAVSSYDSRLAFGLSNESGNPAAQGIYTLGGFDAKYPEVFNLEFIPATGTSTGTTINVVTRVGTDLLFAYNTTTTKVINVVDTSNKIDSSYFITRDFVPDRDNHSIMKIRVCYRTMPTNTTIALYANKNNEDPTFAGSALTLVKHANKMYYETVASLTEVVTLQLKLVLGSSVNNSPEIENLTILY